MTSRERIIRAMNHQPVDRIPVDFGGHRSSGIMAIAYAKLKQVLGITSGNIYIYDVVQQLAIVEQPVLDAFNVDVIEMGRGFLRDEGNWKEWQLPDGTLCKIPDYITIVRKGDVNYLLNQEGVEVAVQKPGCLYFETFVYPMAERSFEQETFSDLEEMEKHVMWNAAPHPGGHLSLDEGGLRRLEKQARALRMSTDRAIYGLFGGSLFEGPQNLFRNDNFLLYLMMYPDKIHQLMEIVCDTHIRNLEKWIAAVGSSIDVIGFGDDFGGQNGPLISPDTYLKFFKPYHKKMWQRVKELSDLKINLHCCGSVEPLLDDFIDAGLDAINPVQISSRGMDSAHLKEKYGDRICLWGGGCDTQRILPNGTPEEVKQHVIRQIALLVKNSGFVFQQVHNIMANVPPVNIIAMFEAVNAF
jgi:uroporphyrinogen decarboxylase